MIPNDLHLMHTFYSFLEALFHPLTLTKAELILYSNPKLIMDSFPKFQVS